ncbi:MAG: class I SAM-dependent methyltransferase [Thermoleophilia bacterium]
MTERKPSRPPRSAGRPPGRGRGIRTPADPTYLRDLFTRSARFYDRVNLLTSLGWVTRWRDQTVASAAIEPGDRVIDAFSGPGGLAEQALPRLGPGGELLLVDISPVMLREAHSRLSRRLRGRRRPSPLVRFVVGDLLRDDLALGSFDVVLFGWGLRYVPDVSRALERLAALLRPGGRLALLEFTRPGAPRWALPLHLYFRYAVPAIGGRLARDPELHEYLRETSATFLDAPALAAAVESSGLRIVGRHSRLGGLVTTLVAVRPRQESRGTAATNRAQPAAVGSSNNTGSG